MPTLDWDVQKCVKKCSPKTIDTPHKETISLKRLNKQDITFQDIVHAYELMAKIVTVYGDKYLPIFERLHREIKERQSRHTLLEIAEKISHRHLSTDNVFEKKQ